MKSDIEISRTVNVMAIKDIASKINIDETYLEYYGKDKAKISLDIIKELNQNTDGKLILVTSMNPTPYGEGKTTITIGLHDALSSMNKKSIATLREPSLGPVFGIKGGATGGGYAQVIPMEDINLHFTGDIHAITTCNNLLCAIVDNHLFQGNSLNLDINEIYVKRCLDINDRALRIVVLQNGRTEHFQITTASEIMAIVCLCQDMEDLRIRLGNILIGKTKDNKPIFAKDLNCVDALLITLKDAIKPNIVQTLEHNPVIIHGGPFANIAHGCSSVIATNMALKLSDYVITEAGFGADLGALKFFDIKGRNIRKLPDVVVMNITVRAIKHHGNGILGVGLENVKVHIENIKNYTNNIIICINSFNEDKKEEYEEIKNYIETLGYPVSICSAYKNGSEGAIDLAEKVIKACEQNSDYKELYQLEDSIQNKINILCKTIYRANDIEYSEVALAKIKWLEQNNLHKYPICIAKTQYSLSDDSKKIGVPKAFKMLVTDISLSNGAGFIVVYMGNIMTMPGLTKNAAYLDMKIDKNGKIEGLR